MAIDLTKLEWAKNSVTETVNYVDENGVETEITVANKAEPTGQFKNDGCKFEEPLPRAHINYMLFEIYEAIKDLDTRLKVLE